MGRLLSASTFSSWCTIHIFGSICGVNNWIKGVLDMFSALDEVYYATESCFHQTKLVLLRSLCQWVLIASVFILCNILWLKCSSIMLTLALFLGYCQKWQFDAQGYQNILFFLKSLGILVTMTTRDEFHALWTTPILQQHLLIHQIVPKIQLIFGDFSLWVPQFL